MLIYYDITRVFALFQVLHSNYDYLRKGKKIELK